MELYKEIYEYKPDFSEQFPDIKKKCSVKYCGLRKESEENDKIFRRSLPIDNLKKKQILPPIIYNNSIYKYRKQTYSEIFPPPTEELIKNPALFDGNYPKKYLQQNFVNIDDESFLLNLNTFSSHVHEKNVLSPVVNDLLEKTESKIDFTKNPKTPLKTDEYDYSKFQLFNQPTKRLNLQ
jgi:hypothetical protein